MKKKVILQFDPKLSQNQAGDHVRDGLSAALFTGNNLWVSGDERTTIERLTRQQDGSYAQHQSFSLDEFIELPAKSKNEVDIEGMGIAENYLWIMGSHSLKRSKPKRHQSVDKKMKRLARVKNDPNRHLLARIPILKDSQTGDYTLHREVDNPDQPGHTLRAAQLHGDTHGSILTEVLEKDEHVGPFLAIPSKDNGFDVEGLAIYGKRIFIGLRGPVLRGWAMVLEVEAEEDKKGKLHLKQLENGKPYKKHFLNLRGKGIRELRFFGEDLYLLAGPTMDLDGEIAIYRWRNVVGKLEQVVHHNELERLLKVPRGNGKNSRKDKAEGLAVLDEHHVLVVFDSPTDERKKGKDGVRADVLRVVE